MGSKAKSSTDIQVKNGAPSSHEAVQRLVRASLLAAVALILSYLETMIPLPVALPGVKLGLANIAVVVALFAIDARTACAVAAVKVFASGFLFGSPMMLAYSVGGTVLAVLVMLTLKLIPDISVVVVSMASAIFHNVGQIAVACVMLSSPAVMLSLPPLAVVACVTGALTGAVASGVLASVAGETCGACYSEGAFGGSASNGGAEARGGFSIWRKHFSRAAVGEECEPALPSGLKGKNRGLLCRVGSRKNASSRTAGAASSGGFGVYREGASFAHALDARAKLLFTVFFFVAAFAAAGPIALALVAMAAVVAMGCSSIGPVQALKLLKPFVPLLLFIMVWDVLFTGGGESLLVAGPVTITVGGLDFAAESAVRFCCMLLGTASLMRTTSSTQLTDGIRLLFSPLSHVGLQVENAAVALGLTFRFIPLFAEEQARIKRAQESRGARFSGGVVSRLRAYATVFAPLFANALRRADSVAFAMESRCYGAGTMRTCLREYRLKLADWAVLALSIALLAGAVML